MMCMKYGVWSAVVCLCAAVGLAAGEAGDAGAERGPELPKVGERIELSIRFGPDSETEMFEVIETDPALLEKVRVPAYPGAVAIRPVEDARQNKTPVLCLLTNESPEDVFAFYRRQDPTAEDITELVLQALLATSVAEGQPQAEPDKTALRDHFLLSQQNGVFVGIVSTTRPGWTTILAGPTEAVLADPNAQDDGAGAGGAGGAADAGGEGMDPEAPVGDPTYGKLPYSEADPFVKIETTSGTMYVELYPDLAPVTVENFLKLVDAKYYDSLTFHRVVRGFMIQGGDDGKGGPGWTIKLEISAVKHARGTLSMARTNEPDSANAQFFIVHSYRGSRHLDGQYAAFGRVIGGIETVDAIVDAAGGGPGEERIVRGDRAVKILSTERVSWDTVRAALPQAAPEAPTAVGE